MWQFNEPHIAGSTPGLGDRDRGSVCKIRCVTDLAPSGVRVLQLTPMNIINSGGDASSRDLRGFRGLGYVYLITQHKH